jgi:hypothetical protein
MATERENKLVDIMFQVGLVLSSPLYALRDLPEDEKAAWIAKQLDGCGFPTREGGGCVWYVLK